MQSLPCFLCGSKLEMRTSKNDKPYFVCDPCGLQVFVRRKHGIAKLNTLIRDLDHQDIYTHANSPEFLRIVAIKNEIAVIKAEIEKIKDDIFIFPDPEEKAAIEALQARLQALISELKTLGAAEESKWYEDDGF